jgi:hypothetical protein
MGRFIIPYVLRGEVLPLCSVVIVGKRKRRGLTPF